MNQHVKELMKKEQETVNQIQLISTTINDDQDLLLNKKTKELGTVQDRTKDQETYNSWTEKLL